MKRLLLGILLVGCAAAEVPEPGPNELAVAQRDDPAASLEVLSRGRERFVATCAGCHTLPYPKDTKRDEWPDVLDTMAKRAKLIPEDRRAVELYLRSISAP